MAMKRKRTSCWPGGPALLLVLAGMGAEAAPGAGIAIRHDPIPCVATDRYARIAATPVPPETVVGAELQFRDTDAGGWYGVRMARDGGRWTGLLPKPTRSLQRFEYRIVMTERDLSTRESDAVFVRIGDAAAPCQVDSQAAVSSPIVVRVPDGAPLMPPVPAGFSPAGVVAAQGPPERGPWKAKWLAATGIAGGLGGAVAVAAAHPDRNREQDRDVITVEILRAQQNSGRVLSISRPIFTLGMRVSDGPRAPLTLVWRLEWHSPEHQAICVTTGGVASLAASPRPVSLDLAPNRFEVLATCGQTFSVDTGRVTVTWDGRLLFDETLVMPYSFRP